MTLSREEIAVRVLQGFAAFEGPCDPKNYAATAVEWSDALLRALTPTPAPVAPPAGKYEPRVGDVVRYKGGATFGAGGLCVLIAPSKKSSNGAWKAYALDDGCPHGDPIPTMSYYWEYLRPATPSELAAAGLAVPPPAPTPAPEAKCEMCGGPHVRDVFHAADLQPPAPEAKRPEWVRIVKSESPSRFKDGDVLRVVKWVDEVPAVDVDGYDVSGYVLYDSKWAPAPCPPPVAGSVDPVREAERAVVKAAEALQAADDACAELYATVKDDDDAHNEARPRLYQLHAARLNRRFDLTAAVRALRTSRPVRP